MVNVHVAMAYYPESHLFLASIAEKLMFLYFFFFSSFLSLYSPAGKFFLLSFDLRMSVT